ncbi:MAG: hypothetical protein SangKO_019770 [Sandaracinaceae bacterium]
MTQVCEELVHALKALVSADGPMELERQWRQAAKLLGEDSQGMRALVDALAEKSIPRLRARAARDRGRDDGPGQSPLVRGRAPA